MLNAVLVDHYDSFTWNLAHLWARVTGALPWVVAHDQAAWDELTAPEIDAIILSPGPGTVTRAADFSPVSRRLIAEARQPILGVCLGHQGLAAVMGGRIIAAPEPRHGRASMVYHQGQDILAGIPSPFSVIRYHSLLVAPDLPPELEVLAQTEDNLVMAMRHQTRPIWGVQFHPESILTEYGEKLIANFIDLAHRASPKPTRRLKSGSAWSSPAAAAAKPAAAKAAAAKAAAAKAAVSERNWVWRDMPLNCCSESLFRQFFAAKDYAVWLDREFYAANAGDAGDAVSILGCAGADAASVVQWDAGDDLLTLWDRRAARPVATQHKRSIFAYLAEQLAAPAPYAPGNHAAPNIPFLGGYVGWFGYEAFTAEGGSAAAGALKPRPTATPDALWIKLDRFIAVDHRNAKIYVVATHLAAADAARQAADALWCDHMAAEIAKIGEHGGFCDQKTPPVAPTDTIKPPARAWHLAKSQAQYCQDIDQALAWIRAGECYQICLTNQLSCDAPALDPLDVFTTLRQRNPAPQAAYIGWPSHPTAPINPANATNPSRPHHGKNAVVSASPERFLAATAAGALEARPIKGTVRRSDDAATDHMLAETLRNSEKDRAENLMIVDLLRNDLSRVCAPGSVTVPSLFAVESFATVHQLVSTIHGQLRPGENFITAVMAAFPGGSMTGAPKRRAMEKIDALEKRARGIYSGALGWLGYDKAGDLAIVIRTLIFAAGEVTLGVGGGIVAQSNPDLEFAEMMLKAQAPMAALAAAHAAKAQS
ncbi:MAG: chorismate-binding protein [Candidatus Symbiobacter sp.]|nr:chorismate-binding protein [Candidatus Symbiobacter sp.]